MTSSGHPAGRVRLVWVSVPLAAAMYAGGVALNWGRPLLGSTPLGMELAPTLAGMLLLVVVGALVASRRPRNPIGWLLGGIGLLGLVATLAGGIGFRALHADSPPPGAALANWAGQWLVIPMWVLVGLVTLVFPDGRLPSPRWRGLAWAVPVLGAAYTVAAAVEAWPDRARRIADIAQLLPSVGDTRTAALWPAFTALLMITLGALVVRYRHGEADERAQIRLLAFAGLVAPATMLLIRLEPLPVLAVVAIATVGGLGPPVAIGVAILRYRLYEIDRIISRTVSYGLIIATLGAVWATGVIGLGTLLSTRLGDAGNDLVVAGATLAVVILFRPLRTRVQAAVDRRFNRTGYQARQAVETLPDRLRDQVDLHTIRAEISATAITAVQPATASVALVTHDDAVVATGGRR